MPFAVPWRKAGLLLAVLALLLLPSLGSAYFGMGSMGGKTGNCPFMPSHAAALCQVNPIEHIQEMQSMFVALPPADVLFLISFLFLAVVLVGAFRKEALVSPLSIALVGAFSYPPLSSRTVLQEAYARGILNSRAF